MATLVNPRPSSNQRQGHVEPFNRPLCIHQHDRQPTTIGMEQLRMDDSSAVALDRAAIDGGGILFWAPRALWAVVLVSVIHPTDGRTDGLVDAFAIQ